MNTRHLLLCASAIAMTGCAGLDFEKEGLTYYDPSPYLFVAVDKDCVHTATPVVIPGHKRAVHFDRGYGSAKLSIGLSNGMITSAGQETDAQVPATLTAVAGLATAMTTRTTGLAAPAGCTPHGKLYRIENGVVDPEPVVLSD